VARGARERGVVVRAHHALFACAAAPVAALVVLALLDARQDAFVITTGAGPNALLGAAWVATWLFAIAVSPSLAVAGALSWLHLRAPSLAARATRLAARWRRSTRARRSRWRTRRTA